MDHSWINYNKNFNCYFLTVRGILSRVLPAEVVSLLWNQAGMFYEEGEKQFTPYYISISDQLSTIIHTKEVKVNYQSFDIFLEQLKTRINQGFTALIVSDVFDLPHTLYYQKKYNEHAIEVVSFNQDSVGIVDHYYKFAGKMGIKTLQTALEQLEKRGKQEGFSFTYYDSGNFKKPNLKQYLLRSIHLNQKIIQGNDPFSVKDEDKVYGIEALRKFQQYVYTEVFEERTNIDISYHSLKEYGNARNNYANILLEHQDVLPGISAIGEEYKLIANKILIVANMILKSFITKKFDSFEQRIMTKLNEIINDEEKVRDMIDDLQLFRTIQQAFN